MSILQDCDSIDYTEFEGPNYLLDEEDVHEPQSLDCRNCEYVEGQVRTRRGFTQVWSPNKVLRVLYNWVQQQYNRIIYLNSDNDVISRNLADNSEFAIISSVTSAGMTFLQAGYRLYMSFFDASGVGTGPAKVWDGTFQSGTPNVENVFQAPLQASDVSGGASWGTFTEPNAGSVTAGEHLFALVVSTWNGYQTAPGLAGRPFTASGSKTIGISIAPATTWPLWVNTIQIAMTTAANPNRWYLVPSTNGGGPWSVGRGSGISVNLGIDIDDVTLAGGGPTEITNTLFNLYNDSTSPHCLVSYGDRTIYITRMAGPDLVSTVATALISEPNQPQYVTAAEHMLNLPEFRDCVTGFSIGGTLYLLGPSWTYAYSDNRRTPVNWAPPRKVSDQIGTRFIYGVAANPAKQYGWVADASGLFYFEGAIYPRVPASYNQNPVWERINFNADANQLRVIDLPGPRLVIVKAPLDGASNANYLLVWDYTRGATPDKIRFCGLWNISAYAAIGDIAVVQSYSKKFQQLWISNGAAGDVKRLKSIQDGDATEADPTDLYDDDNAGIDSAYKVLAVSRPADGVMQQIGIRLRIRGKGTINVTAFSFDQQRESGMEPISTDENSLTPGQRFDRFLDEQSEAISYQIDNGAVAGAYFYWAGARFYFIPWMMER